MNYLLLFLLQLAVADFDIREARAAYNHFCRFDGKKAAYFVASNRVRGTTTKIAALRWSSWQENSYENRTAEVCAAEWVRYMLGPQVAGRVWEELQRRWVRRVVIYHKGLWIYIKKDGFFKPDLITTYFGLWRFGP